mmetsp:Transcript_16488/g.42307  ORF Transcript_16488/g.42307 Transcript_16488/m.42307 type:complete len:390 (-) Transcript_16488:218-1387(-)
MILRPFLRSLSTQLSADRKLVAQQSSFIRRLIPKKKGTKRARGSTAPEVSRRIAAHVMASNHDQLELSSALRARFGAGSVQAFGENSAASVATAFSEADSIEDVIHLSAPASGTDAPHGSAPASVFFFTAPAESDGPGSAACISVWWGAEPSFEDALLRDLQAARSGNSPLSRQQQLDRLALPRTVMKWQIGARSEFDRDEIFIDESCDTRARTLDQLSFSHALQRHMRLLLLEDEMERILSSVKRIIRQGHPSIFIRFLPPGMTGVESGARTMQRLLLMREFNFDDSIMSTPDWLWEQPEREAMYDAMVSEYEIEDRIEAINQQLDYAQATMQSLKDDAHHQHSTFLEYTIVLLIGFEVLVEMHAIGWIDWPDSLGRLMRRQPEQRSS